MKTLLKQFGIIIAISLLLISTALSAESRFKSLEIVVPAPEKLAMSKYAKRLGDLLVKAGVSDQVTYRFEPEHVSSSLLSIDPKSPSLVLLGTDQIDDGTLELCQLTPLVRLTKEYKVIVIHMESEYRSLADLMNIFWVENSVPWLVHSGVKSNQKFLSSLMAYDMKPREVDGVIFPAREPVTPQYLEFSNESVRGKLFGKNVAAIDDLSMYVDEVQIDHRQYRPLAVSSWRQLNQVDIPSLADQGWGVKYDTWRGLMVSKQISPNTRMRLEEAISTVFQDSKWELTKQRNGWGENFLGQTEFSSFLNLKCQ